MLSSTGLKAARAFLTTLQGHLAGNRDHPTGTHCREVKFSATSGAISMWRNSATNSKRWGPPLVSAPCFGVA